MARVRAEPSERAARHRRRHLAGRLANRRALSHLARGQGRRRRGEREKRQPGHKARKQGRRVLAVPASPGDDQLITSGAASEKLGKWAGASWSLELNSHLMPPPQVICGRQVW